MYNKLFTKILDSSVWLESDATRLVWLTLLAVMDQDGFAQFASIGNLAHRARVELSAAEIAILVLESADRIAPGQEYEGKRVERIEGGWIVLNAAKYRDMVSRAVQREHTAERVRRHRALKRTRNASVTQSDTDTHTESEAEREKHVSLSPQALEPALTNGTITERAGRFLELYGDLYPQHRKGARYVAKPHRDYLAAVDLCKTWDDDARLGKLAVIFLTSDHRFAEEGSRTVPQFAALASWCDGKLAEWEAKNGHA